VAATDIDETLRESFARVEQARRYRRWILDQVRPHLGERLLEVGCGVGAMTAELLDRQRVVAVDVEPAYIEELRRRLGEREGLRAEAVAVERLGSAGLGEEHLDSAVLLNVLEHVDDDVAALRAVRGVLRPGGKVVVQVPAHGWLYGSMDAALGHRRRYGRASLDASFRAAGLEPERLWEFNLLGVLGWALNGKVLRKKMFSSLQLTAYEALAPIWRALEPGGGVPVGLSVMGVARVA